MSETKTDEKTYTLEELAGDAKGREPVKRHLGIVIGGRFYADCGMVLDGGFSISGRPFVRCPICFPAKA